MGTVCAVIIVVGLAILVCIFVDYITEYTPLAKVNRCETCKSCYTPRDTCSNSYHSRRVYSEYRGGYTTEYKSCAEANPDGHCKCYSKAEVKKPDIKIPFLVRLKQMGRHNEGCSNCLNYVREETDTIKFTTASMTANDTCKKFMHNCRKNTITKFAPIQGEMVQYTSNCEINNFSGDCPWFKSSSNKGFLFKIRVKLYKWALANYQRWS